MLAPNVPLTTQQLTYSNGLRGVAQTIAIMRQLVRLGRVDPAIRKAAISITFLCPQKSEYREVNALFEYVQKAIRYTQDILDVETLSTPFKTLLQQVGDCDDQSTLLAALCETIGYPTRFVVAGYQDASSVEHVYVQVFVNDEWIDCDPTEFHPMGWAPPEPTALYVERV